MKDLSFGNYIKYLREENGWSQRKLARMANISHTTIYRIELAETTPDTDTIKKIASAFDIPVEHLLKQTNIKIFIGNKLKILRGERSYEEYSKYLKIDPILLERYENEVETPDKSVVEFISNTECINSDYFYNADTNISEAKQHTKESDFMDSKIRKWIENKDNYRYIEFIYNAYKAGISKELLEKAEISIKLK